ncbi:hypothetical protein [Streptomyces acidiscabies]|uniref:Secreted protein n=1 Tax=Streptomyces acidiscabies TaxID=42234 RepID=A0ABU4M8U6_9ACTN|nr:hypothetical protein [Streptomyces acidiscabies]MDX3024042.1 hypothetical protein [Streptomyces acidiscabies]
MHWLILALAVVLAVLLVLGADDTRWGRDAVRRVVQDLAPPKVPYLPETRPAPPWHPEFLLARGRRVRRARAWRRYPQEPPAPRPRRRR